MRFKKALQGLVAALCVSAGGPALAQAEWPSRPITMVVPFPPGGVTDKVARPVAEAMQAYLKQTVVVENRGGAGGGLGMAHVAKSKPDGYTILMALNSVSIIPEADRIMGRQPLYQLSDLDGIARMTAETVVLAVNAKSPWKTIDEFVAAGREREISFGSSGTYGTLQIFMEALKNEAKMKMLHIPYTGAGPAIIGLLGEQIESLATSPASVLEHVKAGRLRVLAHYGQGEMDFLPGVPSLKQAGYNVEFAQWAGLFAPKNVDPAIMEKLRAAARHAANDEKVKRIVADAGVSLDFLDGDAFRNYWNTDADTLITALRQIGKMD